jgi:hypothetical protein
MIRGIFLGNHETNDGASTLKYDLCCEIDGATRTKSGELVVYLEYRVIGDSTHHQRTVLGTVLLQY